MSESATIDLTGGDSDVDLPPAALARPDITSNGPSDTGAVVTRDFGYTHNLQNTSVRSVNPTQASLSRSDPSAFRQVLAKGQSSRQCSQLEPQASAPEPPAKRQRVHAPDGALEQQREGQLEFEGHHPKKPCPEVVAGMDDLIDITDLDESMSGDAAPPQQQTRPTQLLYFGSLPDTAVSIDSKPREDVDLDIRNVMGKLVVVTVKQGAGHAQRSLETIGEVTKSPQRRFMRWVLSSGDARATIDREKTVVNPDAQQVTVKIYCALNSYRSMVRYLLTEAPNPFCATSPAIAHYMACSMEGDKAGTGTSTPKGIGSNLVDQEAVACMPVVIQQAIDTLQAEDSMPETAAPPQITAELLPHQKRGLTFMTGKETGSLSHDVSIQKVEGGYGDPCFQDVLSGNITSERPSYNCGGIISDVMGMGKTLTVIAYILLTQAQALSWANSERKPDEPARTMATLIVVPPALLRVWQLELSRRTSLKDDEYYNYHGDKRAAPDLSTQNHIIVLTSLDLLRRGGERDAELFFNTSWNRVVYDEAHNLKSRASQRFKSAKRVRSRYTWAVTGTPTMTSIKEIQPLFELCGTPNLDNPARFAKHLLKPIQMNAIDCAHRVSIITRTNILRRTPDDSTFQARKRYLVARVSLSNAERALYNEAKEKANAQIQNAKSVSCALSRFHGMRKICSLGSYYRPVEKDMPEHIIDFMALRDSGTTCGVCDNIPTAEDAKDDLVCHITPCYHIICAECLFQGTTVCPVCVEDEDSDAASPGRAVLLSELNDRDTTVAAPTYDTMSDKMRYVLDELQTYQGAKIVVLASYVDTVKVLSRILEENGIQHASVHGDITQNTRAREIKQFKDIKSGCRALIATMGTMGEGQNLAAASRLICLDIEWNPKRMAQAYARVQRIDQEQDVTITQVVTADTVDEEILAISEKRNRFADALLSQWIRPENNAKAELEDIKTWCKA